MKRLLAIALVGGTLAILFVTTRRDAQSAVQPQSLDGTPPSDRPVPTTPKETSPAPSPVKSPPVSAASLADQITRALHAGTAAERNQALNVLLPALVASDPTTAGHLALAWEPGALHDELLKDVIRLWSAADIGGAVTWMTSLLNAADRENAAKSATALVAQSDAPGAIELSQLLRVGIADGSLEHLTQLWTEENPREAMEWIVTQPAGPNRDQLLSRIAWVRAQSEPADAASLVLDHMSTGAIQDEALIGVVRQWALRDPAAAESWVSLFPSGPLQARARAELEIARKLR